MFTSIILDNFESEVIKEERPILFACIRRDFEFNKQTEVLKSIAKMYGDELKICVLDEDFMVTYREKLEIEGTPTFLIFYEGEEKDRMLGQADMETLMGFLLRTLQFFPNDRLEKEG